MTLFNFRWLRRFIRRHTRPIAETDAEYWKRVFSFSYMFLAWNAFGVVCFAAYNGKLDWAKYHGVKTDEELHLSSAQQFSRALGIKNSKVIKVSGLDVSSYEIHNKTDETGTDKTETD
ncbi:uncharacterized protein LOC108738901 [Agrilus planipennis]|uniref:Uncharacterized protein LOC108738901 n=1 Tax=Agrilus planipennis TaxID=224129 RepID=A0A1W4X5B6_AGRPL|nr:uncharacterized protein LOC108738901 [Agrilus planipennis]